MRDNTTAFASAEYDEKIEQVLPFYNEFFRQIISTVKIVFEDKPLQWLDIGCGTGRMAAEAFGYAEIERFVFCDCSAEMLKRAEERFGDNMAEFLLCDVRNLDFTEEFDVVTSVQAGHYLNPEQRPLAMKKCFNALKYGGIFLSFENFLPDSRAGEKIALERWKAYQLSKGRTAAECEEHIGRYQNEYFPITISKQLEIMKKAGFEVETMWLSYMQAGFMGIKRNF